LEGEKIEVVADEIQLLDLSPSPSLKKKESQNFGLHLIRVDCCSLFFLRERAGDRISCSRDFQLPTDYHLAKANFKYRRVFLASYI